MQLCGLHSHQKAGQLCSVYRIDDRVLYQPGNELQQPFTTGKPEHNELCYTKLRDTSAAEQEVGTKVLCFSLQIFIMCSNNKKCVQSLEKWNTHTHQCQCQTFFKLVFKVLKVVHWNWSDNHWNWSDTWPSILFITRAVLANNQHPSQTRTHTHSYCAASFLLFLYKNQTK